MNKLTNAAVRAAIDDCLSGVDGMPSVRADVLNQVRGEVKVKKKFSVGLVIALLATLLLAGAAMAGSVGLFGEIGSREHADARLPALERVAEDVNAVFTTEDGVTITINQAYYDGSRVFISYTKSGPFDVMSLGEGKPEAAQWDWELPGETYGQSFGSESANHAAMVAHLDGSAPRWAKTTYVNVHDGLQIGETYLDIIGGETYLTEDNTLVGWKECIVPEELAADEVTFLLGTFTSRATYYQDETGLYVDFGDRAETTWHPFTVKRDKTQGQQLTGNASGEGWMAKAHLTASAIDVKGDVVVKCPQSWVEIQRAWENPENINYIETWAFYVGGKKVADWVTEGVNPSVDGQLTFDILCKLDDLTQVMKLVPVYSQTGENMAEAITLKLAE